MIGRPRSFDYDEACRLRESGVRVVEIAERFGVTTKSVYIATTPGLLERMRAYSHRYQTEHQTWVGTCVDCGGPATRSHYPSSTHVRRGRCRSCMAAAMTESVAETTLRCSICGEWKPDAAFGPKKTKRARRGRDQACRECEAARRRAARRDAAKAAPVNVTRGVAK